MSPQRMTLLNGQKRSASIQGGAGSENRLRTITLKVLQVYLKSKLQTASKRHTRLTDSSVYAVYTRAKTPE